MTVDNYVTIFRMYSDFTIFIVGHSDDNELILGMVLDCIHECFDRIFRHNIERKALINTRFYWYLSDNLIQKVCLGLVRERPKIKVLKNIWLDNTSKLNLCYEL